MKIKTIAAACAIAASTQAFAYGPTTTPDAVLYISGSSAQFNGLQAIADNLFEAGTIDNYTDTSGKLGSNYRAYFGKVAAGFGTASGKKVLIIERGKGGSYMGVGPLARAQAMAFMAVNGSNCSAVAGASYPTPTYLCGSATTNQVADLGVSDEEPTLFTDLNLPSSVDAGITKAGLTATELANITAASQYNVLIGIAATNNVSLSSLSKAQVAAILSGLYTDWSQVGQPAGPIYVETRAAGSGTKAAANAYFLNAPCGKAVGAAVPPAPAGAQVIEQSSSGNVIAGLNADFAAGKRAIGLLGREFNPTGSDKWKWLQIGGVDGTVANAKSGAYDFFVGQSIQYRNKTVGGARFVNAAGGDVISDIALGFIAKASDPAVVSTLAGVALDPIVSGTADGSGTGFDPMTTNGTRYGNTCAPLQQLL